MTYDQGWRCAPLSACLVALLAASCGDDDGDLCILPELRGTCVEEMGRENTSCFDANGECTWQRADDGVVFEWQNGAHMEYAGSFSVEHVRMFGSAGKLCSETTRLDAKVCSNVGYHNVSGDDWVDTCARGDGDQIDSIHYTCKNGREYDVPYRPDRITAANCRQQAVDLTRCVDENGVRFGAQ